MNLLNKIYENYENQKSINLQECWLSQFRRRIKDHYPHQKMSKKLENESRKSQDFSRCCTWRKYAENILNEVNGIYFWTLFLAWTLFVLLLIFLEIECQGLVLTFLTKHLIEVKKFFFFTLKIFISLIAKLLLPFSFGTVDNVSWNNIYRLFRCIFGG